MPDPASHTKNHKGLRLQTAAILYFLSRSALVTFVFTVPVFYFLWGQIEVPVVVGGAALVTVLFIGYYLSAVGLRCAACSSPVLMDNGNRKHPCARRFMGLNHRARVAWDILFCTNYQCMYCHTRCRCKKSWSGATPKLGAMPDRRASGQGVVEEHFPISPFSGVDGLTEEIFGPGPEFSGGVEPSSRQIESAPKFPPDADFPGEGALSMSMFSPEPDTESVRIAAMSPSESSLEPVPAFASTKPSLPMPWTVPPPSETPKKETAMNRPFSESPPTTAGPNPFLAAAAAMPPPPGPVLPLVGKSSPVPTEGRPTAPPSVRPEFPFDGAVEQNAGAPTPWTLPSMPLPPAQARPLSPELRPASPEAHPVPPDAALPSGLVKEIINTLEDGRRALSDVFQSLIGKLETALTVPSPAPAAPAPAPPLPVATVPVPCAYRPVELPSLLAKPERAATPSAVTQSVPLSNFAASRTLPIPPPVAMPSPAPAAAHEPATTAPRRRFARPSGLAAQQLNTALNQVFEPAAPASNDPSYASESHRPGMLPCSPETPPQAAPAMPIPPVAPRTQAPVPEAVYSPFAVSNAPLEAPQGMPGEPVPFTFLKNNGGHFEPAVTSVAAKAYDPLDDTSLPWMQPLAAHATRN